MSDKSSAVHVELMPGSRNNSDCSSEWETESEEEEVDINPGRIGNTN